MLPMKPDTIARRATERRVEQERAAIDGYQRNAQRAVNTLAESEIDTAHRRLLIECANDWIDAANRWAERAAELGIKLAPIPLYDVEGLCGK